MFVWCFIRIQNFSLIWKGTTAGERHQLYSALVAIEQWSFFFHINCEMQHQFVWSSLRTRCLAFWQGSGQNLYYMAEILPIRRKTQNSQSTCFRDCSSRTKKATAAVKKILNQEQNWICDLFHKWDSTYHIFFGLRIYVYFEYNCTGRHYVWYFHNVQIKSV